MAPSARSRTTAVLGVACALGASACGGDREVDAAAGPRVKVTASAVFATRQAVSDPATLKVTVRNTGSRPVDALAVVLGGLTRTTAQSTGAADPRRPVWIVDAAPDRIAATATDTWSVGAVPAGARRTYRWRLTPAAPGRHVLRWRVASAAGAGTTVTDVRGAIPVVVGDRP